MPRTGSALAPVVLAVLAMTLVAGWALGAPRADAAGRVVAPANGATVTGRLRLAVERPRGIRRVAFTVDGHVRDVDTTAPFRYGPRGVLDTRRLANGRHRIAVRVRTSSRTVTHVRDINVRNDTSRATDAVRDDRSAAAGRQVAAPAGATADPGSTSWRLVFRDDFDGPTVDPAWWAYDGPGHQGNGFRSPSAFTIENGVLVVTAQMVAGRLVSGGLYHSLGLRYGRFEFRVRTDPDPSGVTSGVVLTWPESDNWPADGENDIYETGSDPARTSFNSFVHYGADDATVSIGHPVPATQWHTMAMDWEPGAIRIYRDGVLTGTITDRTAIPDVAHHLCIQLDPYAPQMTGRARMYVDDVRIYART